MIVEYKFFPYVSARNNEARPLIISVNAEHPFMLLACLDVEFCSRHFVD
jgi:hypothetical protein